jgi:hypothetical protein
LENILLVLENEFMEEIPHIPDTTLGEKMMI